MSLDNIQLPSIVIEGLFKNSLVVLNNSESKDVPASEPKNDISFLGSNKKNITIVVWDDDAIYLAEESLTFLIGILGACKLTMEDVALVNAAKNNTISYQEIQKYLQAEKLLLFGVTPEQLQLPLTFPQYQIQKFDGGQYLTAPALLHLAQNKNEKTKLWNCLKQFFSIA